MQEQRQATFPVPFCSLPLAVGFNLDAQRHSGQIDTGRQCQEIIALQISAVTPFNDA